MAYQGPVKPGTNEQTFRDTGKSVPSFQGPVRPGDDESRFRSTGRSGGGRSSGSSSTGLNSSSRSGSGGLTKADRRQREADRQAALAEQQAAQQKAEAEAEAKRQADIQKQRASTLGRGSGVYQPATDSYGSFIPSQTLPNGQQTRPGFYTAGGQFYPTTQRDFVPRGFTAVPAVVQNGRIAFAQKVSTTPQEKTTSSKSSGLITPFQGEIQPLSKTPYRDFIRNRNPVTGTLSYVVEAARGRISKTLEGQPGQNPLRGETGERISQGVQLAPFVIPATAPVALAATGAGALTPSGIRESKAVGQTVQEKTGIPAAPVSVAYTGLQVAGGGYGAKGLIGQIGKVAGFPKYNVNVVSRPKYVTALGDGTVETGTISAGTVTRKNLIGTQKALFASEDVARISPSGEMAEFTTLGRGVTRQYKGLNLANRRLEFGKPQGFVSTSSGLAAPAQNLVQLPLRRGVTLTKRVPGSGFVATSRVITAGKKQTNNLVLGRTFELPSGTISRSQFAPLFRQPNRATIGRTGRGSILGFTKRFEPLEDLTSSAGGASSKTDSTLTRALKEITKSQAVSAAFPTKATASPLLARVSAATITTQKQSGETKKISPTLTLKQDISQKQIQKTMQQLAVAQQQLTDTRTRGLQTIQPLQRTAQRQRSGTALAQAVAQTIAQSQKTRGINTTVPTSVSRPPSSYPKPTPFFFDTPFPKSGGNQRLKKLVRKALPFRSGYAPSLIAAVAQRKPIKVTPEQFKKLIQKTYSGLEVRPVVAVDFASDIISGAKSRVKF